MAFEINTDKVKAFFADVSVKAQAAAQTAVKKTGEVAESAKQAITLKSEQQKLERLYTEMGKLYYNQENAEVLAAQVMEIDEQKRVIDELKAQIAESKGKTVCASCGKELEENSLFCNVCGAKQEPKKNIANEPCAEKAEDAEGSRGEPLSAENFIAFFKKTMEKYFG